MALTRMKLYKIYILRSQLRFWEERQAKKLDTATDANLGVKSENYKIIYLIYVIDHQAFELVDINLTALWATSNSFIL